ncbi:MAG: hypothetical protein ACJ74W_13355 [Pyrinomonadaceae bacterium]
MSVTHTEINKKKSQRRKRDKVLMQETCDGKLVLSIAESEQEDVLKAAIRYVEAGLSVIPIRLDCTNAPDINKWKDYASRLPTKAELRLWFNGTNGTNRLAVMAGKVSGNLEILRFKKPDEFSNWKKFVEPGEYVDSGTLNKMPLVRASNGDLLLFYRYEQWKEGQVLHEAGQIATTLQPAIDVLGADNFAIVPPSRPACHGEETPFRLSRGDLTNIPVISAEERDEILFAVRYANESAPRSMEQIQAAEKEMFDKVWYYRNYVDWVNNGKNFMGTSWINYEGAKQVREKYGAAALGPWTDFELGMMNGKLSALRWVMGSEWDFLDT